MTHESVGDKKQPSVDVVIKMAQFFGVSTDALLLDHLELPDPDETPPG